MNENSTNSTSSRKALARRIVDRIASDLAFREQIVDSPPEALHSAGFSEQIQQLTGEVSGYSYSFASTDLLSGFGALLMGSPVVDSAAEAGAGMDRPKPLWPNSSSESGAVDGVEVFREAAVVP